jgi:hypothetical protein
MAPSSSKWRRSCGVRPTSCGAGSSRSKPKNDRSGGVARLSEALLAGLGDAELRKRVTTAGYEPAEKNTPSQFADFIAADTAKWLDLVAKTNMKAN